MEKELLSIREASGLLGVAETTLRDWLYQKRLPFYRLGRAIRLKKEDIFEFREKARVEDGSYGN
jgi:excisionase family DNA binding protein